MPVANDDVVVTSSNHPISFDVLANDTGTGLVLIGVTNPAHGQLTLGQGQQLTYTPDAHYYGADSFIYTVRDADGAIDQGTVSIDVRGENRPPKAHRDTVTTDHGQPKDIAVIANDSDPDDDPLLIAAASVPSHGSLKLNADQSIRYTPDAGFSGVDSFAYTVTDLRGGFDTAQVFVTVNSDNAAPVAVADTVTTDNKTEIVIDILGNDVDLDGDSLNLAALTKPLHGGVRFTAEATIVYTPDGDYVGEDQFSYTIVDAHGARSSNTVTIDVTLANEDPTAEDDRGETVGGRTLIIDVLANDSDPNDDTLAIHGATMPTNGVIEITGDNKIAYTPDLDFEGADTFTYTVADGKGGLADATVQVLVSALHTRPIATEARVKTLPDLPALQQVTANALDPAAGGLRLVSVTGPTYVEPARAVPPRVFVCTDAGRCDFDGAQNLVMLLLYADRLRIEGLCLSWPDCGFPARLHDVIDAYEADLPSLSLYASTYPTAAALRALMVEGAAGAYSPVASSPTAGSQALIAAAQAGTSDDPLYVLAWSGLGDVAQALSDDPTIAEKIRLVSVDPTSVSKDGSARGAIIQNHPHLWWLEIKETALGIGADAEGRAMDHAAWANSFVQGQGALGTLMQGHAAATPPLSVDIGFHPYGFAGLLYLLDGVLDDPSVPTKAGAFAKVAPFARPDHWTDSPEPAYRAGELAGATSLSVHRLALLNQAAERFARAGGSAPVASEAPGDPAGVLEIVGDGSTGEVRFTPAAGLSDFRAYARFEIEDSNGRRDESHLIIDVKPSPAGGNRPPLAQDNHLIAAPNQLMRFDVVGDDIDLDGDNLIVTEVTPLCGTGWGFEIVDNGTRVQVSAPGEGECLFFYSVSDGLGGVDTGYARVVVTDQVTGEPFDDGTLFSDGYGWAA
ncbi:MAG: Ig-like domain-containing protein [Geminicoccaceae bacterium]